MNVAVLDDYQMRAHEFADWSSLGSDVNVTFFSEPMDEKTLVRALVDFEILVLMRERTPFPGHVLEQLPALRLVVTAGMNSAKTDLQYLKDQNIRICGTFVENAGAQGVTSTAECAWALIFATAKRLVVEDRAMRAGKWQLGIPSNLAGLTLGLAGLGVLGAQMVAPAKVFGMHVIAWSEHLTDERSVECEVRRVTKDELLREADVLSIHLVLSDRTHGLFGAVEFEMMKSTAILINTSRGPIVDEMALVDALRTGQISSAGLDVFDREPVAPENALLGLDNVVLSPHMGFASEHYFRFHYGQMVEDIRCFLQGKPIRVIESVEWRKSLSYQ